MPKAKSPSLALMVERAQPERISAIRAALEARLPGFVRPKNRQHYDLFLEGQDGETADDAALSAELGALIWGQNDAFCHVEIWRWDTGYPGGGRTLLPDTTVPYNSLGLSDLAIDEMIRLWESDEGPEYMARDTRRLLMTPAQKRVFDTYGVGPRELLTVDYPMSAEPEFAAIRRDWNARLGRKWFGEDDLEGLFAGMIASVEENLDATQVASPTGELAFALNLPAPASSVPTNDLGLALGRYQTLLDLSGKRPLVAAEETEKRALSAILEAHLGALRPLFDELGGRGES